MDRERKPLTVTVDGESRDATWEQGVGIWVSGHDINVGEEVKIEGTPYAVRTMSRLVKESQAWTLIKKAEEGEDG